MSRLLEYWMPRPEVSTTFAVHKAGTTMKVRISVRAVYGEQQDIIAVEAVMFR